MARIDAIREHVVVAVSDSTAKDGSMEQPRPRRRVWLSLIVYLLIFTSGLVCGAGITAVMVQRHIKRVVHHPELAVEGFAKVLDRRLDLTPDQRTKVREILGRRQKAFQEYRRQVQPLVVKELRSLSSEIEAELNEDQKPTWRKMTSRMRRWVPEPLPPLHEDQGTKGPKD